MLAKMSMLVFWHLYKAINLYCGDGSNVDHGDVINSRQHSVISHHKTVYWNVQNVLIIFCLPDITGTFVSVQIMTQHKKDSLSQPTILFHEEVTSAAIFSKEYV